MRIAIVGAGISGMTAAYYLSRSHDVSVFEANDYIGGHANTATVKEKNRSIPVDTGFIVFNQQNYPNLCRLFDELNVASINTDISFSVHCEQTGLEDNGTSFNKLFSQRRNIINIQFWKMLKDINRFHKEAVELLNAGMDDRITVEEFSKQKGYGDAFLTQYLIPLGASLWSSPADRFRQFPMLFVIEFLNNHCMLQLNGRPQWKTVKGGSKEYVSKLINSLKEKIQINNSVSRVIRHKSHVEIVSKHNNSLTFDEVIICCHSDQAIHLMQSPDEYELELLQQFQYQQNEAVLHTDISVLPKNKKAWASWNYRIPKENKDHVSVTYNMNCLQSLAAEETYCVSLNQTRHINKDKILKRIIYHHPQFSPGRSEAQSNHTKLIRRDRVSYCGAYWGYGFHEDGVSSALRVCDAFDIEVAK